MSVGRRSSQPPVCRHSNAYPFKPETPFPLSPIQRAGMSGGQAQEKQLPPPLAREEEGGGEGGRRTPCSRSRGAGCANGPHHTARASLWETVPSISRADGKSKKNSYTCVRLQISQVRVLVNNPSPKKKHKKLATQLGIDYVHLYLNADVLRGIVIKKCVERLKTE